MNTQLKICLKFNLIDIKYLIRSWFYNILIYFCFTKDFNHAFEESDIVSYYACSMKIRMKNVLIKIINYQEFNLC